MTSMICVLEISIYFIITHWTCYGVSDDWLPKKTLYPEMNARVFSHYFFGKKKDPVPISPEAYMTSVKIIKSRGYPVEVHHVLTDDGYILELHRIPYGKKEIFNPNVKKKAVFLQHGFLASDADWLANTEGKALAFILADEGYDVWLGNARGNRYSRHHVRFNQSGEQYWEFSWHEMGKYDIPAVLHFTLSRIKQNKLIYIGHSMGTTMFFVAMILHPELNANIELMIAMAPAASLAHSRSPLRYMAPFAKHLEIFNRLFQTRALLPSDGGLRSLQNKLCERNYRKAIFCRNIKFWMVGANPDHFNLTLLPVMDAHSSAGTSVKTMTHFMQNYNAGEVFLHYNYGYFGNLRQYRQPHPPAYDLSRVTAPVYIFWGQNDLLTTPEDTEWLAKRLGNLQASIRVNHDFFNHLDFLWGTNALGLLYTPVLELLPYPYL